MLPLSSLRYLALSLAISPVVTLAATPSTWKVCPPSARANTIPKPSQLDPDATYVEADNALLQDQGDSILEGDVIIAQSKQALRAASATYNKQTQQVNAQGQVRLESEQLELNSEQINYNLGTGAGEIFAAYYRLPTSDARGKSAKMIRDGERLTQLQAATYTTCPPHNETWRIEADQIQLYHQENRGVARKVKLKVKDIPVFYFPYFSFPLEEKRKSGFLVPEFKSDDKSGLQISFPYYFNLAPHYDLTVAPTVLSQRGLMVKNEFRYLQPNHKGNFVFNVIPSDRKRDGKLRYQFDIDQSMQLAQGKKGSLTLKAGGVSDNDYIDDFGGSLAATSTVNLERNLTYKLERQNWSFHAVAQDFQVLTTETDAYTRLPQFTFNFTPKQKPLGLQLQTTTEYTHFYSKDQPKAQRLHVKVKASKPIEKEWGFIRPSISLDHTSYSIDRNDKSTISRTLPTVSLDSGLIFEKRRVDNIIQTLEPRLFYTYTPYKDQADIPIFDSAEKTLTYNELFAENRFTGKDRVNDANRLTTSLTTRLQNTKTGREKLRASIGQIAYFDERKVTLPDQSTQTGKRSEVVMELSGELNARTRVTGSAFYDTKTGTLTASQAELNYKDQRERLLNVNYGKRKDSYEAIGITTVRPINNRWKVAAGWDYDLKNHRTLENVGGVQYESCCWKTRVAARRYLQNDNTTYDQAVFVEFELKGLGSLGSGARTLLQNRVTGYE
ncbi:MAG: LPS-assembly protein LptD [Thiofilum sp.]|uniref:LPS-assembly protein LptD n=1 Tax=Thiofilum sp. TaxID=2212733 RepID=UPI0025E3D406|nr:LPS-assembly protein LptD [Thiofilum sp.]MBK8455005.1 LPS-assembly protein LptD [Thiofilum sp.]